MTWTIEPSGAEFFVARDERRFGPLSFGEATAVNAALNGLTRVRLLRGVVIPGGPGVAGQIADIPNAIAQDLLQCKGAELVAAASNPNDVHDLRGKEPLLKGGRITTRRTK